MACKASFELYHNFPKVAEEAGFAFSTHRPRIHIEWNKIRLIDLDSLIRERKFVLIEHHINDILDCVLESEFDVRILDEGFLKIFRLAQLAVEYQQFCRHYLDRSVHVLRNEITCLAQELDETKRNLKEKEEENRRSKKRSRHASHNILPYNENIATLILNTIKNQNELFPKAPHLDVLNYNKCNICDKVFLNQLYLKSHIARRHSNSNNNNQKENPIEDPPPNDEERMLNKEDSKLNIEVENLKMKLKEMESLISQTQNSIQIAPHAVIDSIAIKTIDAKETKDAEVCCTSDEDLILNKIEQWKKDEFEKYNKEITLLRNQITSVIKSNEEKEDKMTIKYDNSEVIKQLQQTIKQQGVEICSLKQNIQNSKSQITEMEIERKRDIESQISQWAQQVETQSNQCKTLMQKLNGMEKEVQKYKDMAEEEKEKSTQIHDLMHQNRTIFNSNIVENKTNRDEQDIKSQSRTKLTENKEIQVKDIPAPNRNTLEKLQKKAQELLEMDQSSTDLSSTSNQIIKPIAKEKSVPKKKLKNYISKSSQQLNIDKESVKKLETKEIRTIKQKSKISNSLLTNENVNNTTMPVSPVKVIRAKITEEVNARLIQLGVDPLRNRLPMSNFHKQKAVLQAKREIKEKKCLSRGKIRNYIIAYLDSKAASSCSNIDISEKDNVSPNKINKTISSVLSNVKTKALSLVKPYKGSPENKSTYTRDSNKSKAVIKSPPESINSSPKVQELNDTNRKYRSKKNTKDNLLMCKKLKKEKTKLGDAKIKIAHNKYDSDPECVTAISPTLKSRDKSGNSSLRIPKEVNDHSKSNKLQFINDHQDDFTETNKINIRLQQSEIHNDSIYDEVESFVNTSPIKAFSEENIFNPKQSKGVLKMASSTSSLNKKKVVFDMDVIQMKSASATPSQSLTEKSDSNDKYALGIINLDGEEWDISSIENESTLEPTTIKASTRASPKVSELKQIIESQMAKRIQTSSLAGSVNVLPTPMARTSLGGSNTSLGSSILDESENLATSAPTTSRKMFMKKGNQTEKDDSDVDLSELLNDDKSDNKF